MALVIGFSFPVGHDPAVAAILDGRLVFATEEERYTRHKHAMGEPPVQSMLEAFRFLERQGINPQDVDAFALPFDLSKWRARDRFTVFLMMAKSVVNADVRPAYGHLGRLSVESLFRGSVQAEMARKFLEGVYRKAGRKYPLRAKIVPVEHHLAHAASAHYFSGFDSSTVLSVDGAGEAESTTVWRVRAGEFERLSTISFWEGSLGFIYDSVGGRIGFETFEAPGKVMGLAPYGGPVEALRAKFGRIARVCREGPVPYRFSDEFGGRNQAYPRIFEFLTEGLDFRWNPQTEMSQPAANMAWNLQEFLEGMMAGIASWAKRQTGEKRAALAGGVALNAKSNMELYYSQVFEEMFVFPAANDAGAPIGAAAYVYQNILGEKMHHGRLEDVYLGQEYDASVIRDVVRKSKWSAEQVGDDVNEVARLAANGKCVAWFQGRSELGPRALGDRSIVADPTRKEMWRVVNDVKGREYWRPLAPSVLEEAKESYFEKPTNHRFMILMMRMNEASAERLPAVCHVDRTARPQMVHRGGNQTWHELIKAFSDSRGERAVINTSFNLAGEPLVQTPSDALRSFALGPIDALYLQGWLIKKS